MDRREPPEVVERTGVVVAGVSTRIRHAEADFGAVWDAFGERAAVLRELAAAGEYYGVATDFDPETESFTYVAGVPVASGADVPDDLATVTVPAGTYAVFPATPASVGAVMDHVYDEWLPDSGYARGDGPDFELYEETVDADDPDATLDVYVPIVAAD